MSQRVQMEVNAPTVIDDALIRKCIYIAPSTIDLGGNAAANAEAKKEAMEFYEIECLIFSFKNILAINHLVGFARLRKLQLDNNVIEKIENLGHLTELEWLDLSFNNISKIENLETLTKLTDLSLFNNKISVLENMDALTNLQILSIGNNKISALDNLLYLRRFRNLRVLNIKGNPVCRDPEYRSYVLAHVRELRYLEYRLIDEAELIAAREQYQEELLELKEKEAIEDQRMEEEKQRQEMLVSIRKANIDGVVNLYHDLFMEDKEFAKLLSVAALAEPMNRYRESVELLTEDFKRSILEHFDKKTSETSLFNSALQEARDATEKEAFDLIERLTSRKKRVIRDLKGQDADVEALRSLRRENDDLSDQLMELEMHQVEQFEEVIKEFERLMSEILGSNIELIQNYFTKLRDIENDFHENVSTIMLNEWERLTKAHQDDTNLDETLQLLTDKDAISNILNTSHDTRTGKIDALVS
eukprot:TRINITY_DN1355_c1_g1_i2.p1 TRINITY_DN1355_c1_g1~~TRINITY_DN1355_c1_g1_i2.p1  ORF type:complete len:474 (-),score=143.46 TRINITY_DN1355_c1_g1_i2:789-2210(-)